MYMQQWPVSTEVDAEFAAEFPELSARIKRCGLGVYKLKAKRGQRGDMLGLPTWWLRHFDFQISGFTQDKPDLPYTRDLLVKRVDRLLKDFRKEQRAYKSMSRENRVLAIGQKMDKAWEWACRNGHTYDSFINARSDGGDCAVRLRRSVGVWLWGEGQILDVEIDWKDDRLTSECIMEAYRAKALAHD